MVVQFLIPFVAGLLGGGGGINVGTSNAGAGGLAGGLLEIGTNKQITSTINTDARQFTDSSQIINTSNTTINREFTFQNVTGGSSGTLDKTTSLRPSSSVTPTQSISPTQSIIPSIASPTGIQEEQGSSQGLLVAGLIGVGAFFFFKKKKGSKK